MRFLIRHGEKVVCAAILVLCGVWMYADHSQHAAAKQKMDTTLDGIRPCEDGGSNDLPASFPYQPSQLTPYAERLKEYDERAGQPLTVASVERVFYPQPERPVVEPSTILPEPPPVPPLAPYKGLRVEAHQGRVVVTCTSAQKPEIFLPVAIEVQRGNSADRFDRTVHIFELTSLREDAAKTAATDDQEDGTTPPAPIHIMRRGHGREAAGKAAAKPAAERSFKDTAVTAGTTCYYRARLLTRLPETSPGQQTIIVNGAEVALPIPASVERVQDPSGNGTLYASPWSPVAQATVPVDLQLRYQFVARGTLPADRSVPSAGYSGFLGVRLWDAGAQAWGEGSLAVAVGEPVKGRLVFQIGAVNRVRVFDTGLVLQAIRRATKIRVDTVRELVTEERVGQDGTLASFPVVGEDGQFVYAERHSVTRTPTEVAVLKARDTDREVRLVKGLGFEEALPADVKLVLEGHPEPPSSTAKTP